MTNFSHYRTHVGGDPETPFKSTVFEGTGLKLETSCLEPGQSQPAHVHDDRDKFYYVVEGHGEFVVGEETRAAGVGTVVAAPAGTKHGVTNNGSSRLVLLVGLARSQREEAARSSPSSRRRPLMPTKRVRKTAKRAARKVKKTAGRARKKAKKTAKRAKKAVSRARKSASKTAKRAKKAAKRARKAVKSGAKKAKRTAKRAKKTATQVRDKAASAAKRTKRALGAARKRASKTAKQARKAVRRIKKRR